MDSLKNSNTLLKEYLQPVLLKTLKRKRRKEEKEKKERGVLSNSYKFSITTELRAY